MTGEFTHRSFVLFLRELVLAHCTQGAFEISRDIFPLGAGSDASFGITFGLVIDPAANVANILHNENLLSNVSCDGSSISRSTKNFRDFITMKKIDFLPIPHYTVGKEKYPWNFQITFLYGIN